MRVILLLVVAIVAGCASYKSYNQTTTGRVVMRGGVYQKKAWDDSLIFRRMSWYHGMTLYYDVLLWKADSDSPFANWFSPSEKEYFTKCESIVVTAGYSSDPAKISHVNFREQMKLNGYDDVVINNFSSYLKTHPQANDWRLQNYKIMGYCKRSPSRVGTSNIVINFPGFKHLEADL